MNAPFKKQKVTGIILAGGQSSRMGKDKGMIELKGKTFMNRVLEAIKPLVWDLIIVGNKEIYGYLGYPCVDDIIKDAGPLAGLHAGLHHSKTSKNLVLSCDIPLIKTAVLKGLLVPTYSEQIVQYRSGNRIMPLVAMYTKSCEKVCEKLLEQGERRLLAVSEQVPTKTIQLEATLESFVQNINTPEQLKAIQYGYTT